MSYFITHDDDNRIIVTNYAPSDDRAFLTSETSVDPNDYFFKDNHIHAKPANADPFGVFDVASETWSTDTAAVWFSLRFERNVLLGRSDWTQAVDSPLTDEQKQSWRTYRQALRDLPANTDDPANPIWPVKPT